ncbi:type III effector [Paracidovorax citrulli]|uniref:type III effector n=1 Tax=Paracidovorax citrulli TaxID=80869 RepID=UPI000A97481E|nr:type III effector [Paracidovorax citrulli]
MIRFIWIRAGENGLIYSFLVNMFRKILSGGSSSQGTWNALNSSNRDDIVKVHENVHSSTLGISGGYRHKTVSVPSEVFENLKAAGRANRITRNVMHAGAGNQVTDIRASQGESWARDVIARRDGAATKLKRAQKSQGGNCAVFASVAGAALHNESLSAPIMRRRQSLPDGGSHEFLLIGDPRVARWGESKTVVVDPWPGHPSACTLDQAVLHDSRTGQSYPLAQLAANSRIQGEAWAERAPSGKDSGRMESISPLGQEEINKQMRKMGLPPVGEQLTAHALADDSTRLFDVRVGTDPSTQYMDQSDGETRTFDDISATLLNQQYAGRQRR